MGRIVTGGVSPGCHGQFGAADPAIVGFLIVPGLAAPRAGPMVEARVPPPHLLGQLRGKDARGHGDDGIADDHDHGGNAPPEVGFRRDIAETHRGQRNHRPVDAHRDIAEPVFRPFDQVHGRSEYHQHRGDGEQKDGDFQAARPQGVEQQVGLIDEADQFEDPEDPEHSQYSNDLKIMRTGNEQAEIKRDDREQIDDPVEAENILMGLMNAKDSYQVFDGE